MSDQEQRQGQDSGLVGKYTESDPLEVINYAMIVSAGGEDQRFLKWYNTIARWGEKLEDGGENVTTVAKSLKTAHHEDAYILQYAACMSYTGTMDEKIVLRNDHINHVLPLREGVYEDDRMRLARLGAVLIEYHDFAHTDSMINCEFISFFYPIRMAPLLYRLLKDDARLQKFGIRAWTTTGPEEDDLAGIDGVPDDFAEFGEELYLLYNKEEQVRVPMDDFHGSFLDRDAPAEHEKLVNAEFCRILIAQKFNREVLGFRLLKKEGEKGGLFIAVMQNMQKALVGLQSEQDGKLLEYLQLTRQIFNDPFWINGKPLLMGEISGSQVPLLKAVKDSVPTSWKTYNLPYTGETQSIDAAVVELARRRLDNDNDAEYPTAEEDKTIDMIITSYPESVPEANTEGYTKWLAHLADTFEQWDYPHLCALYRAFWMGKILAVPNLHGLRRRDDRLVTLCELGMCVIGAEDIAHGTRSNVGTKLTWIKDSVSALIPIRLLPRLTYNLPLGINYFIGDARDNGNVHKNVQKDPNLPSIDAEVYSMQYDPKTRDMVEVDRLAPPDDDANMSYLGEYWNKPKYHIPAVFWVSEFGRPDLRESLINAFAKAIIEHAEDVARTDAEIPRRLPPLREYENLTPTSDGSFRYQLKVRDPVEEEKERRKVRFAAPEDAKTLETREGRYRARMRLNEIEPVPTSASRYTAEIFAAREKAKYYRDQVDREEGPDDIMPSIRGVRPDAPEKPPMSVPPVVALKDLAPDTVVFSAPPSVPATVAFTSPSETKRSVTTIATTPTVSTSGAPETVEGGWWGASVTAASKAKKPKTAAAEKPAKAAKPAKEASPPPSPEPAPSGSWWGANLVKASKAKEPKAPKASRAKSSPVAAVEKEKAQAVADSWWGAHLMAKSRDKSKTAKKVVTKASEYDPSKNDFAGVDTEDSDEPEIVSFTTKDGKKVTFQRKSKK